MDAFVNVCIFGLLTLGCSYALKCLAVILSILGPEDRLERQAPVDVRVKNSMLPSVHLRKSPSVDQRHGCVHGLIRRLSLHYASSTCLGVTCFSCIAKRENPTVLPLCITGLLCNR
jgi:hypothetical protein